MARAIKEVMYIRVNNPTLNGSIRKYNLPHLWDRILHSTPELKINNNPQHYNTCAQGGLINIRII